jgi:uncharacterized protein YcbX
MSATVTEIWRYPVKSMGGETIDAAAVGERGLHADRMWAVRDPALGAITSARRLPQLLRCTARYPKDPAGNRATVRAKLSKKARRLLRRHARLLVTVTLSSVQPNGSMKKRSKYLTLRTKTRR